MFGVGGAKGKQGLTGLVFFALLLFSAAIAADDGESDYPLMSYVACSKKIAGPWLWLRVLYDTFTSPLSLGLSLALGL